MMRKTLFTLIAVTICLAAVQVCAQVGNPNRLSLDVPGSVYIRPGNTITLNLDVAYLSQPVCACQAFVNFSSMYFLTGPSDVSVAAGGGVWDELIWGVWNTGGDLDTAVGIDLDGSVGTTADGTVAKIVLKARSGVEGATSVMFRPDANPDPYLVGSTILSDTASNPVWPTKVDSPTVIIDGTSPLIHITSVSESGAGISPGGKVLQGTVNITVTASDPVHGGVASGLTGPPAVTITRGNGTVETATFLSESPSGTFNYTWIVNSTTPNGTATIAASAADRSGNRATDSFSVTVNKNQISGTVAMDTLRLGPSASYSFDRLVTLKATNIYGSLLQTWLVSVHFVNDTGAGIASGQYLIVDAPSNMGNLSAKTDWALRSRQAVPLPADGQAVANFTGSFKLLGGDLTTDNVVNVLDYQSLLTNWLTTAPAADINGDGVVNVADFNIMKLNWFKLGSPI